MRRIAVGSLLPPLGFLFVVIAVSSDARSAGDVEYAAFGWDQKAGVVIGCAAVWLGCIVLSGWRPPWASVNRDLRAVLRGAQTTASESTWLELAQTRTVRHLGVVQAVVILATALSLLAFTSAPWYMAFLAAFVLSIGLNLAISRFTRALSRDGRRRPR